MSFYSSFLFLRESKPEHEQGGAEGEEERES